MPAQQRQRPPAPPRKPSTDLVKQQVEETRVLLRQFEQDLAAIMPHHVKPETFMGLALAAVRRDDKLRVAAKVNPPAFIMALRTCAYLGHVVTRGQFALVPFRDKDEGWAIAGVEEYQGLINRFYRSGGVRKVGVEVGRANDAVCRWNPTTMHMPHHEFNEFDDPATRGPLIVAYAWADLVTGGTVVAWLPTWAVLRRRRMAKTEAFWGPPHPAEGPNTEPMWKKSAYHALEPMVPTSVEYREAMNRSLDRATSGAFAELPTAPVVDPDVIDGEMVGEPEPWPETAKPADAPEDASHA
jgi:recombination protein RecT